MTGSSGLAASACRLTEVQFRVVEFGTTKRGRAGGGRGGGEEQGKLVVQEREGGKEEEERGSGFFLFQSSRHILRVQTHTPGHTQTRKLTAKLACF